MSDHVLKITPAQKEIIEGNRFLNDFMKIVGNPDQYYAQFPDSQTDIIAALRHLDSYIRMASYDFISTDSAKLLWYEIDKKVK